MSYDLHIYSCFKPTVELSSQQGIYFESGNLLFSGRGWQVVFHRADTVDLEDIPISVARELPGIKFFTLVTIEGSAPRSAISRARSLAKMLAKKTRGVILDPQRDSIESPRGVKRYALSTQPSVSSADYMTLSWWFHDAASFVSRGYRSLVEAIEILAPEALPRRYGLWEPPPHTIANDGRDHFVSFLRDNIFDTLIWYPSKPFLDVHFSIPPQVGPSPRGYRSCYLTLEVAAAVLAAPGWPLALKRLWLAISKILSPFYSEIRLGDSPTRSWWWNGIPRVLGFGALLGSPYLVLWPTFAETATFISQDLVYQERLESAEPLAMTPPLTISQPVGRLDLPESELTLPELAELRSKNYPEIWPFEDPYSE